ncbi:PIG-L family deacetylase [Leptospira sp. FAT2]|uniref:PIG-L deacetylase family protein n=1 Tax=Leptospira sanjuanensis TaxID=2879643 RepID=UPI001EE98D11|nr:PIG-L deacetylase family protein [Leptospira sanjuanensis]MCG6167615.1 PIG-L family deacetylase [Leptospira sanjuanensis]MCG6193031.1 PIG-L family deacetylase [Leptospira sanjuanensis]
MKILAIGAHFDDVELGCGGALLKWKSEGHHVAIYVATKSGYESESGNVIRSNSDALREGKESALKIGAELFEGNFPTFHIEANEGLHKSLLNVLDHCSPDLLLVHWNGDVHHDHRVLADATLHVSKRVRKIIFYRSNWYQSAQNFTANYFVDITAYLDQKVELIKIHQSEFKRTFGKWERYIKSQAEYYGFIAGCSYAEGFHVLRWLE